jgi:hypothetical protein
MRRLFIWVAFAAAVLLAVAASASNTPTRRLKQASWPITAVAMDGPRVIYSTGDNGVYVWNVQTGATVRVRLPSPSDFPPGLIPQVALAGQRVAWITQDVAGNSMETNEDLFTASIGKSDKRHLAHAFRIWDFDNWAMSGDWIGGLVGSGKLLVVSTWTARPSAGGVETFSNAQLSRIGSASGQLQPIAAGDSAIVSSSADRGQVAVLRPAGTIGIYSGAGALVKEITPPSATQLAMGGGRVIVLTKTNTLEVYDSRTGALEHRWSVAPRHSGNQVGHLQAYGRIAIVSVDPRYVSRNLRILDLKTGRSLFLPKRLHSSWNDATVGPLGIVYANNEYRTYGNHHPSGTLVFVSTARVLKSIARGHW